MKKRLIPILLTLALVAGLALPVTAVGCPCNIEYRLGTKGISSDKITDAIPSDTKPDAKNVPAVEGLTGWAFVGWSTSDPEKLPAGQNPELVKPEDIRVKGDTVYYAVYEPFHKHYVIGYPNGKFGPDDYITRGSVATIIARAGFEGIPGAEAFEEGKIYENDAGLIDVAGHWAESAISYCAKNGVFVGYGDGYFKPDQSITREEYVAAVVRLARATNRLPGASELLVVDEFLDITDAGDWARADLRTAQTAGWVNGYAEGENVGKFLPQNPIRRDEAVKIFNGFLRRGVDEKGLEGLEEYVCMGGGDIAEGDTTKYMTWPDVPKEHWAYYEIIEAANDHAYNAAKTQLPEDWSRCWIDKRWRYYIDPNDGGPLSGTGDGVDITKPPLG